MHGKLTITLDEDVYLGLHRVIGARKISGFIEKIVRPHVVRQDLDASYAAMARDEAAEAESLEWSEGLLGDVADDPRKEHQRRYSDKDTTYGTCELLSIIDT